MSKQWAVLSPSRREYSASQSAFELFRPLKKYVASRIKTKAKTIPSDISITALAIQLAFIYIWN